MLCVARVQLNLPSNSQELSVSLSVVSSARTPSKARLTSLWRRETDLSVTILLEKCPKRKVVICMALFQLPYHSLKCVGIQMILWSFQNNFIQFSISLVTYDPRSASKSWSLWQLGSCLSWCPHKRASVSSFLSRGTPLFTACLFLVTFSILSLPWWLSLSPHLIPSAATVL